MGRAIGEVFAKRFTLQQRIGHGGNGEVYEVLDERLGAVRAAHRYGDVASDGSEVVGFRCVAEE